MEPSFADGRMIADTMQNLALHYWAQRETEREDFADASCWSRGQAWLIHGFAQTALTTGNQVFVDAAEGLALKAGDLLREDTVPAWDFGVEEPASAPRDSSAGAIIAAGLYLLADVCPAENRRKWLPFADSLLGGLLDNCDLTSDLEATGLLAHGACTCHRRLFGQHASLWRLLFRAGVDALGRS